MVFIHLCSWLSKPSIHKRLLLTWAITVGQHAVQALLEWQAVYFLGSELLSYCFLFRHFFLTIVTFPFRNLYTKLNFKKYKVDKQCVLSCEHCLNFSIPFVFRSKKSVGVRSERSTMTSNDCTYQAGKRQRLEKGHLNMVCYYFLMGARICCGFCGFFCSIFSLLYTLRETSFVPLRLHAHISSEL